MILMPNLTAFDGRVKCSSLLQCIVVAFSLTCRLCCFCHNQFFVLPHNSRICTVFSMVACLGAVNFLFDVYCYSRSWIFKLQERPFRILFHFQKLFDVRDARYSTEYHSSLENLLQVFVVQLVKKRQDKFQVSKVSFYRLIKGGPSPNCKQTKIFVVFWKGNIVSLRLFMFIFKVKALSCTSQRNSQWNKPNVHIFYDYSDMSGFLTTTF